MTAHWQREHPGNPAIQSVTRSCEKHGPPQDPVHLKHTTATPSLDRPEAAASHHPLRHQREGLGDLPASLGRAHEAGECTLQTKGGNCDSHTPGTVLLLFASPVPPGCLSCLPLPFFLSCLSYLSLPLSCLCFIHLFILCSLTCQFCRFRCFLLCFFLPIYTL